MPNRVSFFTNAWESTAPSGFSDIATTLTVGDAAALQVPCYIVIDPDDPALREYVWVASKNGNDLNVTERNLAGSNGQVTHAANATVRSVASAQAFTDLHLRIDANAADIAANDPAGVYLPLAGGTMAGVLNMASNQISNLPAPTLDGHAARKVYVDTAIDTDIATHTALPSAHHTRYTDGEAIAAIGTPWTAYLPLAGGTMAGPLDLGNQTLLAPLDPTLGTHVGDRDYNDARYALASHPHSGADITSGTVAFARLPTGTTSSTVAIGNHTHNYLPIAGGTITGDLGVGGGDIVGNGTLNLRNASAGNDYYSITATDQRVYIGGSLRVLHTSTTSTFNNRVAIPEGSATSPSLYSPEASNDTGIYFDHGLNRIGFVVDGNASNVILSASSFSRVGTTTLDLGSSTFRWDTIFLIASPDVSSDESLKDNIVRSDAGMLATVRAVQPASFTRRGSGRAERGFIANDFDAVDNGLSHMNENGERSVRTLELISTAWGALRELAAENDALKARVAALESA